MLRTLLLASMPEPRPLLQLDRAEGARKKGDFSVIRMTGRLCVEWG